MHDLNCKNAVDMYSPILASRVKELKETEEGVQHMCKELEELIKSGEERGEMRGIAIGEERGEMRGIAIGEHRGEQRGIAIGEQRGVEKTRRETAATLAEMGFPIEQIAKVVKINTGTVRIWLDENLNRIK